MEEAMTDQTRFLLNETDLPKFWYNINADSPVPPAPVLLVFTLSNFANIICSFLKCHPQNSTSSKPLEDLVNSCLGDAILTSKCGNRHACDVLRPDFGV